MASLAHYTGLITSEHAPRPNYVAMVGAIAQCFVSQQSLLASIPPAFALDTAVASQLDAVGLWIGISRKVGVPISGVYFSLDTAGLGFDQGNWQGPFDPNTGIVSLDDATYRLLLYAKVGANNWDGTLASAASILSEIFGGASATVFFLQDNEDMTMTLGVAGQIPSALFLALLATGGVVIRPEGVLLSSTQVTSINGKPLFGFDVENPAVSGFDVGAWGIAH